MTATDAILLQAPVRPAGMGKLAPSGAKTVPAEADGADGAADFLAFYFQFASENEGGLAPAGAESQTPQPNEGKTSATGEMPQRRAADGITPDIAPAFAPAGGLWHLSAMPGIAPAAADALIPEASEPPFPEKPDAEADHPEMADSGPMPILPGPAAVSARNEAAAAVAAPVLPQEFQSTPRDAVADSGPVRSLLAKLLAAEPKTAAADRFPAYAEARAAAASLPGNSPLPEPPAYGAGAASVPGKADKLQPATPQEEAQGAPAFARTLPAAQAMAAVSPEPAALRSGASPELADDPLAEVTRADAGEALPVSGDKSRVRGSAAVPLIARPAGEARDGNPPAPERKGPPQAAQAPRYSADAAGGADTRTTATTATQDAPAATGIVTGDGETRRDPAIVAAANVTAVRQETHFAPVMPQQPPAQQIAERITGELAADPPAPRENSAAVSGTAPSVVKVLHLQLNPPGLGPLAIRMTLKNGALDLQLETGQPQTAKLIERDREAISGMLRSAGYMVDGLTVQIAAADRPGSPSLFTGAQQQQGQAAQGWQQPDGHNPGQPWQGGRGGGEAVAGNGNEKPEQGASRGVGGALYL